jgi:hypothetical protein
MKKFVLAIGLVFSMSFVCQGQGQITPSPYFSFGKGLGIISPDSMFLLNIRFRLQNRTAFTTVSDENLSVDKVEARVRRMRLRFDGFIYSPKLYYLIQLAFTRSDMDFDDTGFPNVIRDAMLIYSFNKHLSIGLGQTKLPGNRQRVNSSGDLQLADRSLVNSLFNVDRDFGAQVYYNNAIGGMNYVFRGAVSSGEGRNFNSSDNGLAYTGRVELLPLGKFTNGGDYFEGDLAREPKPKLSIGATISSNKKAIRTGGQLGKFLFEPRNMETRMLDILYKHNGVAFSSEFLSRTSDNPITENENGDKRYIYAGWGENYQLSYLWKSNYELVGRYTHVTPGKAIRSFERSVEQYTVGLNRYIRGHRLKLQGDITYEKNYWVGTAGTDLNRWQLRFQIEAGI